MFVKLENPAVVQTQPFPHRVTALHGRIKGADPSIIAMHQLSVDVHNQVAVSFVEFLQHVLKFQNPTSKLQRNFNRQAPKRGRRPFEYWRLKFLWMLELGFWSFYEIRTTTTAAAKEGGIDEAAHSIPGSARKSCSSVPALHHVWDDTAETKSSLPPRHTNAWPKFHPSRANPAARTASTR